MVKVKSWLFTEVRGKVKKAEFRRRKNKVTELSQKRIPFNPRTERQQKVRKAYGKCVEEWNNLSEAEKREWRIIGTLHGISGYNAFMRECISEKLGVVWYEITIDNSANPNDLTDYQILLNIVNDSTFFNNCENEQKYLEFYDSDKASLLNHFVEEFDTINKNAKIWIKVPSIPANASKIIYLKINTSRTEDLSNPYNVFEFYDDFEGDALNTDIWYVSSPDYSVSNSILRINQGGIGMNDPLTFNLQEGYAVETKCLFNEPPISGYSGVMPEVSSSRFTKGGNTGADATAFPMSSGTSGDVVLYAASGSGTGYNIANGTFLFTSEENVWYLMSIRMSNGKLKIVKDDDVVFSETGINWKKNIRYVALGRFDGESSKDIRDTSYDFIRIRKYTEPEPVISYEKA